MARAEQYAWLSLGGLVAVYWFFQMRMLDGLTVASQSAEALFGVFIAVIVLTIIIESVIAGGLAARGRLEKDERDRHIEAQANLNERLFLVVALNVFVGHLLADNAFANHVLPSVDLTRPEVLFFVLFSILFAGEFVKRATTLWLYRAGGVI